MAFLYINSIVIPVSCEVEMILREGEKETPNKKVLKFRCRNNEYIFKDLHEMRGTLFLKWGKL